MSIKIITPGLMTSVQDCGRYGYQASGFSVSGATKHDIELFKANVTGDTKIKAAGGISSIEDAEEFIKLGASRLGTSRIVKAVKQGNLL